jgi:hypothetical protein
VGKLQGSKKSTQFEAGEMGIFKVVMNFMNIFYTEIGQLMQDYMCLKTKLRPPRKQF